MSESESQQLNLVVFVGSVRGNELTTRVRKFLERLLESRKHIVTFLNYGEIGFTEVKQPLQYFENPDEAPAALLKINEQIKEADGFVVVATEDNSAVSPALCGFMDNFPPTSYAHRPAAIVTYSMGRYGGIRAGMQLRQFLTDLTMIHLPSMIVISKVQDALQENGETTVGGEHLNKSAETMVAELEWYAAALQKERLASGVPA